MRSSFKMPFVVVAALLLFLPFLQACAGEGAAPDEHAHEPKAYRQDAPSLQEYDLGGDFSLIDHNGQRFNLSDHDGEIRLLFFGYTSCPDICPTTLSKLTRVYRQLEPEGDEVLTLFVSVDPTRDTPEKLAEYLGYFSLNAIGLTGHKDEIDRIIKQYGGDYFIEESDSAAGPLFAHTTYLYLIDRKGTVRFLFTHEDTPEWIAAGISQLLDEETS
jgi:protein SCO1/2